MATPYTTFIDMHDFDRIPKEVWANIALSFAICRIDEEPADFLETIRLARDMCVREWHLLHGQGIIPQKPRLKRPASRDTEANEPVTGPTD